MTAVFANDGQPVGDIPRAGIWFRMSKMDGRLPLRTYVAILVERLVRLSIDEP